MARIVIDARQSGTSTGRYIDKLVENLYALQPPHELLIVTKPNRQDFFATIAPDLEVIPTTFKEFTFGEQLGFRHQLNGLKPDLVHFGMVQQPVFYRGTTVTTMHDLTTARFTDPTANQLAYKAKQQVYRWVNKRVAHTSAAIFTPTEYIKNDIVAFTGIAADKVTVTYEAADHITGKPEPVDGVLGDFILYVGRPTPHKNLARLVDAFAASKVTHPELQLVLAGKRDANYDGFARRVESERTSGVIFTDYITDAQLRWLYEHCTAYVFPSLSEGFGLPGLEAMVQGAPVVSSSATCLPEVYGDAAVYFDPLNVGDMAAKISAVLDDAQLRKKLIAEGNKQVAKYSWKRMAQQTLAVYNEVLTS